MQRNRPALFRDAISKIRSSFYASDGICAIRSALPWSGRDDGGANLGVDHSTIARWVLRYAPELNKRIRRELRDPNRSWRVDETYIRVAGRWTYLYRAIESTGETIDFMLSPKRDAIAAKHFLRLALARAG